MSDYPPANERHIADIKRIAELEAALKAIVDNTMMRLEKRPPETDCYGINARLLYEAKQVLEVSDER